MWPKESNQDKKKPGRKNLGGMDRDIHIFFFSLGNKMQQREMIIYHTFGYLKGHHEEGRSVQS